jgi:hypothetical protein
MQATEWRDIVARLNASYPGQEISPETAAEWYTELAHLDPGDIWLAVRALRREHHFRPTLAELLVAYKAHRAELAEQAASQQRRRDSQTRGTPMPPETRQAMEILKETLHPDTTLEQKAEARLMIDTLAGLLADRTFTASGEVA